MRWPRALVGQMHPLTVSTREPGRLNGVGAAGRERVKGLLHLRLDKSGEEDNPLPALDQKVKEKSIEDPKWCHSLRTWQHW